MQKYRHTSIIEIGPYYMSASTRYYCSDMSLVPVLSYANFAKSVDRVVQ